MEEINMQHGIFYRVELHLTHNANLFLSFDIELYQIRLGSVDQRFKRTCIHSEVDRFFAVSINYTRNHSLFTDGLTLFFAESVAFYTGDFDCFHKLITYKNFTYSATPKREKR